MRHPQRFVLSLCLAGAALPAHAEPIKNSLVIVVVNGPFAGTYQAGDVICIHSLQRKVLSAAWKDFNLPGAKALSEAGLELSNPEAPGTKHGIVRIAFGDAEHNPTVYQVLSAPLTFTAAGKGGMIRFDGKTAENIRIQVTATCGSVDEL